MTSRDFFRAALVGPLLGLVIAAVLHRPSDPLPAGWEWVYPTSLARAVLVYGALAVWLWVQLDRRTPAEFARLVWWTPVLFVLFGWSLMLALALLRGKAAELWAEHSGQILLRAAVHLTVGYGYVLLIMVARRLLREGGRVAETT